MATRHFRSGVHSFEGSKNHAYDERLFRSVTWPESWKCSPAGLVEKIAKVRAGYLHKKIETVRSLKDPTVRYRRNKEMAVRCAPED